MGWSDQNVIAQIIVIEGSGDGLFIYNGTGELGNPPILAAVAPGVTEDPFGNTVKAVLNIGNFSASHIGWDADGNQYLSGPDGNTRIFMANGSIPTGPNNNMDPAIWFFNDFGAAVLVVDPSAGGTFQYEDLGSATQGGLIGAQQGKTSSVNDPVNNQTVPPGILLIDPVFGDQVQIVGGNINWSLPAFSKDANDTINQGSGSTSPYRHISAPEQTSAGHAVQRWYGTSVDGTVPPGSVISSTDPPVRASAAMLEVQGTMALENESAPASVASYALPFASSGHLNYVSADGDTYDTGRLTLKIAQQTVSSSTGSGTALASKAVGIGTYKVSVFVPYRGATSAGTAVFAFTAPSVTSESCEYLNALSSAGFGANGTVTWSINPQSSLVGTFTSPTLSSSSVNVLKVTAIVTFSAAGTLAFNCKCGTAGDNVAIFPGYMDLQPVVAS